MGAPEKGLTLSLGTRGHAHSRPSTAVQKLRPSLPNSKGPLGPPQWVLLEWDGQAPHMVACIPSWAPGSV